MDIQTFKKRISRFHSFVLLDQILDIDDEKRIIAIKNVTLNEPFFQNQELEDPVFPDSMIIESILQAASLLLSKENKFASTRLFFDTIDKIQFKGTAKPGDQLRFEIEQISRTETTVKIQAKVLINGTIICEGKLTFKITQTPSKPQIHPTASVHPSAILGKDVSIGPYAIIGEHVIIGDRTTIEAHSFVDKWTQIGEDCKIHFGCVLGSPAQDVKYKGERAGVIIGNRSILREYVTVNRATGENQFTRIGDDVLLLTNVHIGHNCTIDNKVIITNSANVAGHVHIEERAIIGGMVGMHQFVRIGKGCMIGGYSRIPQDVPPFMLCEGNPAYVRFPNLVGLKRSGASRQALLEIKTAYKILFRSQLNTKQAIEEIQKHDFQTPEFKHLYQFITADSKRGITKKPLDGEETEIEVV